MRRQRKGFSRRQFLAAGAGAAVFTIVPRHVLGGAGHVAPSDTITYAVIGTGGMGRGHVGAVLGDKAARLVAVCDVDGRHLDMALGQARKGGRKDCKGYRDFREVLARVDVDVVRIPTPPHWHGLISVAAMEAGCDVWSEKPMTRTIAESQRVVQAIKDNGRMFRINTWFRLQSRLYGSGWTTRPIKKLVSAGLLGWPLTVRVSPDTGFNWKMRGNCGKTSLNPEPVPSYFDYDMWLGHAPFKPYSRVRTHGRFRGYWDYEGGGLGDMGQHYLDPVQYILDKDHTSPVTIEAYAPWPPHPDAVGPWGRVEMTYADGCRIIIESGEWGERITRGKPYFEGPKGKILKGGKSEPAGLLDALPTLPDPAPMIRDFHVSVKTRQKFGLNEDTSHRSNMLLHLANIAIRTGRKLRFDPVAERFVGDEQANRLIDQPMRAPWHL